jgi:hypothetical protein
MFLSAIEKAFSTDYGLAETSGFLKTGSFLENMTGVTGQSFNWSDSRLRGSQNPAMFWFSTKTNDLSLLWVEKNYLQSDDISGLARDRLLPATMIWGKDISLEKVSEPASKFWVGQGNNPVCMMRTSWTEPNAIYLGFKAGSASVNHAHMDVGSFVMESDGVRWACDFGMQEYESLESKGIRLFGRTQDAQRWSVFRLNNYSHNTLTVDNQLQIVKGYAPIIKFGNNPDFMYAISDLSDIYTNQLTGLKRGVAIVNKKFVVVRDELKATDKNTTVRWTMLTSANVAIVDKNLITLTQGAKQLYIRVETPSIVRLKTWSTTPATGYDAPNPGTTLVGFECDVPANASETLQVILIPGESGKDVLFSNSLDNW